MVFAYVRDESVFFFLQENGFLQRMSIFQASSMGWHGAPGVSTSSVVKKIIRLDVPVDKFPSVCK